MYVEQKSACNLYVYTHMHIVIHIHLSMILFNNTATCKIEDATKNERVKVEPFNSQYIQDDHVIIVCDSGYQMANRSDPIIVRTCLSNQTWSGIDPHCEKSELIFAAIDVHV